MAPVGALSRAHMPTKVGLSFSAVSMTFRTAPQFANAPKLNFQSDRLALETAWFFVSTRVARLGTIPALISCRMIPVRTNDADQGQAGPGNGWQALDEYTATSRGFSVF